MLVSQSQRLSVPSSVGTILQVRETSSYQRTFYFRNWSASVISLQFQELVGSSWVDLGTDFDLGVAGGGSDVAVQNIVSTAQLRVRGSGGSGSYGSDREIDVYYARFYYDADSYWDSPVV